MMKAKPSAEQLRILGLLAGSPSRQLQRWPGGFWTAASTPVARMSFNAAVPVWWTTLQTVRTMEQRGWIARANVYAEEWRDERVLTPAGWALCG